MSPPAAAQGLSARLGASRGAFELSVDLTVGRDETLALVGPNGAGKTTALELLSGLQPLESGYVELRGRCLADTRAGVFVPPERRNIGVVFQDGRLFPALDAVRNVAFGLRARGMRRRPALDAALATLDRLDAGHLASRAPAQLSGGEARRVALARALATEPGMLLLDEPFTALDVTAAASIRGLLRQQLAGFDGPRVLITHSPLEVMTLADRLAIIEDGRIVQTGTLEEIRRRPRSPFVAGFIGLNLVRGRLQRSGDGTVVTGSHGTLTVTDPGLPRGSEVAATVAPQAVAVSPEAPRGSPRNVIPATIQDIELAGDRARLTLEGEPALIAEITAQTVIDLHLTAGQPIWATVKATEIDVMPL